MDRSHSDTAASPPRRAPDALLLFAIAFPTALTWLYMRGLAAAPSLAQQGVYAVGKALQFGAPLVWWLSRGARPSFRRPRRRDLIHGALFGGVVAAVGLVVVVGWIEPRGGLAMAAEGAAQRARSFGLSHPAPFVLLAVFYSVVHAFLEEAYWRGFVDTQLHHRLGPTSSLVLGALAFAAHHVVVLSVFFGLWSWWPWLLAGAVAIGGAVWAVQRRWSGSLWGPWLGHALIDTAIFVVGYRWVFG